MFTAYSVCGKKPKNIKIRDQSIKKFDFFPQSLTHIPRWVHLHVVQKTRAKNSHAWAPLKICVFAALYRLLSLGGSANLYFFYVLYSTLLHLLPLRFNCVGGCWDRTQDCCDFGISSQTLQPL